METLRNFASADGIAAISALASAVFAGLTFWWMMLTRRESRAHDRVVVGAARHPRLRESAHSLAVLSVPILNGSQRTAVIEAVRVLDDRGKLLKVSWSGAIDECGNLQEPIGVLGIDGTGQVFIRRPMGEPIPAGTIIIKHSLSAADVRITLDIWGE